jgi:hypothetical protein
MKRIVTGISGGLKLELVEEFIGICTFDWVGAAGTYPALETQTIQILTAALCVSAQAPGSPIALCSIDSFARFAILCTNSGFS